MRLFPEWSRYTVNPEALRFHAVEEFPLHQLMAQTSLQSLRISNNAANGTDIQYTPNTSYFDAEAEALQPLAIIENAGLSSQVQYPVTLTDQRGTNAIISESHATLKDMQPSTVDIHLHEYQIEGQQTQDLETLRMLEELVQNTLALSIPGHFDELSAHEENEIRVLEQRLAAHEPSNYAVNFANAYQIESGSLVNTRGFNYYPHAEPGKLTVKAGQKVFEDIGERSTAVTVPEIYATVQQLVGHPFYIKFPALEQQYPGLTPYLLFNTDAPDGEMFRDIPPGEGLDKNFLLNESTRASRRAMSNETQVQIVQEDIRQQLAELYMRKIIAYHQKKIAKFEGEKAHIEQLLADSGIMKSYELYSAGPNNEETEEGSLFCYLPTKQHVV